jgi:NAD(P)-dependent dehydrogenase (short-subunit alcohol dehydrogenase family)
MEYMNNNGTTQKPLGSGFSATSSAADVIKGVGLSGKIAIVTGGYAGIGLETVKTLAGAGAEVWVPARDVAKAQKSLEQVAGVTVKPMDLMAPDSIDAFAGAFLSAGKPLHLLINNAGIMWVPLRRDSRGNESQLSTNHLGHFQLTARLWPALKLARGARVVTVSSYGHHIAAFDFEDPNFERRAYETLQGYGHSKTANNLFSVELDRRASAYGVRAYSLHPGSVNGTDLGREASMELFIQMGMCDSDGKLFPEFERKLKTPAQGAATSVWCATSPMLKNIGGVYCENCDVAELDLGNIEHKFDEPSTLRGVKPYSIEPGNARRLWELTEEMTNIEFPVN